MRRLPAVVLVVALAFGASASAQHTGGSFGGGSFGEPASSRPRASPSSSPSFEPSSWNNRPREKRERPASRAERGRGGPAPSPPYVSLGKPDVTEAERALRPYVRYEELASWTCGVLFATTLASIVALRWRRKRRARRARA